MACERPCCRGQLDELVIVRDMADRKAMLALHPNLVHTRWAFINRPEKFGMPAHVLITETATQHPLYHSYPNGMYYTISKWIAEGVRYTCLVS